MYSEREAVALFCKGLRDAPDMPDWLLIAKSCINTPYNAGLAFYCYIDQYDSIAELLEEVGRCPRVGLLYSWFPPIWYKYMGRDTQLPPRHKPLERVGFTWKVHDSGM
jgi:hypothetical protein